jgi:hypothetical protein
VDGIFEKNNRGKLEENLMKIYENMRGKDNGELERLRVF